MKKISISFKSKTKKDLMGGEFGIQNILKRVFQKIAYFGDIGRYCSEGMGFCEINK
jgi:hypothetical protein